MYRRDVTRGSWRWTLQLAQLTAWGTAAFVLILLQLADISRPTYRWGLALVGALAIWLVVLFGVLLPNRRREWWLAWLALVVDMTFAASAFALLREGLPSTQLIFVPVIIITGLLSAPTVSLVAAAVAFGAYWSIATATGGEPTESQLAINAGLFVLTGGVAGALAREVRSHYSAEQEEHRLATAVRLRLTAVLDAVDEAIVFRDRQGIARLINRRAGELFDIDPNSYLGLTGVELLRSIARLTEDPEGFMETFQELRDEPELELRVWIDQIIPERRQLRLYSAPTFDDSGALVGRIDVYTNVTESVRRADEIERLYEEARQTAESYQRSLLPSKLPRLPGMSLVAHYVPAAGRRAVCGDFYDFLPLQDGRVGIVLGDVSGAGPLAVNDAALARYTLRSFATEIVSPDKLLRWMNGYLCEQLEPERFVRLVFGVLDPERAVLEYACAGHVPPVVYRARDGSVEWLDEGGMALGVESDAGYKAARIELDEGDMLVLYTDGVTEAPRHGRPMGQGKFSDIVSEYGVGTPGELVQALRRNVEWWVGVDELRDDLALLVCQVVPETVPGELTRELVLPNDAARMSEIRGFVASFLADVRVPVETSHEILLAVGEAAANAARHGRRQNGRSEVRVRCVLEGSEVDIAVADDGPGFEPQAVESQGLPDRFASGGRGLFLMRQLTDDVTIDSSPSGTIVHLVRRVFG
jgi:serine phosphatase RsbU (regulator of sigma subunit)/anti-sigma regulatory factor (Ser/Thr protein kinase)